MRWHKQLYATVIGERDHRTGVLRFMTGRHRGSGRVQSWANEHACASMHAMSGLEALDFKLRGHQAFMKIETGGHSHNMSWTLGKNESCSGQACCHRRRVNVSTLEQPTSLSKKETRTHVRRGTGTRTRARTHTHPHTHARTCARSCATNSRVGRQ